jgi:predicted phosphodiesterase
MLAIISDLHSNEEALGAVVADMKAHAVDEIFCLGDVVGYGPDPIPVVDFVRENVAVTVMGNHDEALIGGGLGFSGVALKAIDWTRTQLQPGFFSGINVRNRWDFLTHLPLRHERGPDLFLHGSPRDPTSEYLLAHELSFGAIGKYEEIFATFDRLLFCGHTHLPCVITDDFEAKTAASLGNTWTHPGKGRAIVNVGSVGQPRDEDNRASYVLFDGKTVTWRRVAYDFEKTAAKVFAIPELDRKLGERLALGR